MSQGKFPSKLVDRLRDREQSGLFRSLKQTDDLIDFCSNDYLGLSSERSIHERVSKLISEQGTRFNGSTGSRLIRGNTYQAEELEAWLAQFHRSEAALIFNSGFDANLGIFSSVPQRDDTILYDKLIHASIHDGIRLSYAKSYSFKHNDVEDVRRLIRQSTGQVYIAVESLYSMDGDIAPLADLASLCKETGALLIIDEAHATGVFGPEGRGLAIEDDILEQCIARIYTFGKAIGAKGAVVVGAFSLKAFLINFARSFIYTTALPIYDLLSVQAAYDKLLKEPERRVSLFERIKLYKDLMKSLPDLDFIQADGPIQGVIFGSNQEAIRVSRLMQENGLDVRPILSPTVPVETERIRICIHSFNQVNDMHRLFEVLRNS